MLCERCGKEGMLLTTLDGMICSKCVDASREEGDEEELEEEPMN